MNNTLRTALAVLSLAVGTAATAAFPDKPIKVVIGFPAGGPLDQHARLPGCGIDRPEIEALLLVVAVAQARQQRAVRRQPHRARLRARQVRIAEDACHRQIAGLSRLDGLDRLGGRYRRGHLISSHRGRSDRSKRKPEQPCSHPVDSVGSSRRIPPDGPKMFGGALSRRHEAA